MTRTRIPANASFLVDAKYCWVRVLLVVPLVVPLVEHLEIFDKVLKRAWRFGGEGWSNNDEEIRCWRWLPKPGEELPTNSPVFPLLDPTAALYLAEGSLLMSRVSEQGILPAEAVYGDTFSDTVSNSDRINCVYLREKGW